MKRIHTAAVVSIFVMAGLAAPARAAITVSSNTLDFGSVQVGGSLTQSLSLTNTDVSSVSVPIALVPGDGVFSVAAAEFVLPPLFSAPLDVTFTPTSVGSFNAVLSIFTGDAGNPYFDVALTGSAAAVPEPESYAMFLAGLGVVGALIRRKQNVNV